MARFLSGPMLRFWFVRVVYVVVCLLLVCGVVAPRPPGSTKRSRQDKAVSASVSKNPRHGLAYFYPRVEPTDAVARRIPGAGGQLGFTPARELGAGGAAAPLV